MIYSIVDALFVAWILSLFEIDDIFVDAAQTFVTFTVTVNHYYLLFGMLGAFEGLIRLLYNLTK